MEEVLGRVDGHRQSKARQPASSPEITEPSKRGSRQDGAATENIGPASRRNGRRNAAQGG